MRRRGRPTMDEQERKVQIFSRIERKYLEVIHDRWIAEEYRNRSDYIRELILTDLGVL
jgi:Arc/MetJ-type ribon-helix-helix transcriptional regulator